MYKRYFIEFEVDERTMTMSRFGVTAMNLEDALEILSSSVFGNAMLPPIKNIVEDVNIEDLDQNHVVPNIGSVFTRGIWFPMGF